MYDSSAFAAPDYLNAVSAQPTQPTAEDIRASQKARIRIVPNADEVAAQQQQAEAMMQGAEYDKMVAQMDEGMTEDLGEFHGMLPAETMRWGRFGVIDNGVLVLSMMTGNKLEGWIEKQVGVKGYGVLVGGLVGNAISDGFAAIPEGWRAAGGVTAGALLPLVPVAIAMKMKRPLRGGTAWAVGLTSAALLFLSFRKTISRVF